MAASNSTTNRTTFLTGRGRKSSLRKIAMKTPSGMAKAIAIRELTAVPSR
jgi:hypothetical protein